MLHRAVQSVLSEGLSDPRLEALITVTGVQVSADLAEAVVSVSILPEARHSAVIHGLRDAAGHIRHAASERVSLARPPRLVFKLDKSLKREARVLGAIAQVKLEEGAAGPGSETDATSIGRPGPDRPPADENEPLAEETT